MKANVKWPKGLVRLHAFSLKCMVELMKQGKTENEAESIVMELLKESEPYLKQGMYDETIASLKMIVFNESVEKASEDLMKKFTNLKS